jgi:molybdenum cofactor cytidylyltransferase
MRPVGLVILAAGGSSRLGRPKQLVEYRGRSLLRHVAEVAVGSVCRPIVVVLGAQASPLEAELRGLPVHVAENREWARGMATSLRRGLETLEAIEGEVGAVVILLCDQPLVSAQTINALVDAWGTAGKRIIASEYAGVVGVPALFDRGLLPELLALDGEEGARRVIARHADEVHRVPFPDGGMDIDTPQDCERFRACSGLFTKGMVNSPEQMPNNPFRGA